MKYLEILYLHPMLIHILKGIYKDEQLKLFFIEFIKKNSIFCMQFLNLKKIIDYTFIVLNYNYFYIQFMINELLCLEILFKIYLIIYFKLLNILSFLYFIFNFFF